MSPRVRRSAAWFQPGAVADHTAIGSENLGRTHGSSKAAWSAKAAWSKGLGELCRRGYASEKKYCSAMAYSDTVITGRKQTAAVLGFAAVALAPVHLTEIIKPESSRPTGQAMTRHRRAPIKR